MLGRKDQEGLPTTQEVNAFLGKGTAFQGEIRFEGMFRIDGRYDGKILSGDSLVIGETAEINAEITVKALVVNGRVRGNITANNRIEIHPSGQIRGDIQTPSLIISEGAIFEGNCKMEKTEIRRDEKVSPLRLKENETKELGRMDPRRKRWKGRATMSNEIFRFETGKLKCIAVSDGTLTYVPPTFPPPATLLFANASRERLEQVLLEHNLQPEQWGAWTSPYICLVINTGDHLVLVDTGAGGLAPTTGRLLQNLQAEGIAPENIDTVILTHGHPDHIGGNTDGEGKPAFPNARYVMWKDEWDFWTSEQAEQKLDQHVRELLLKFARKNLPPIQGKVDLFDREEEIVPGIRAVAATGHTPGHMAVEISSEGEQLLCISDTVLHPIHLEQPQWCAAVDFAPEQAVTTRRRLLSKAAVQKALVLAFHFPFPGLGRVVQKGEGWQWQPVEATG